MASSGADRSRLRAALSRHRAISLGLVVLLILLAWLWLLNGAGMGMPLSASLWPAVSGQASMAGMPAMPDMMSMTVPLWTAGRFALILSMWWVMMAAMMLPSAAPTILLYERAAGHAGGGRLRPPTEAFMAGYLIIWGLFSIAATVAHWQLERAGVIAPMEMSSISPQLTAAVLILAGAYQLSPLKNACLRQCRNPAQFLARHYRPGRGGALRMGLLHGAYCVGCCWMLMALLFVGGVMNLAWIAVLTVLVAAEKLLPHGRWVGIGGGLILILGGGVILLS